jgi:polyhydroxybutyrate depolymerase
VKPIFQTALSASLVAALLSGCEGTVGYDDTFYENDESESQPDPNMDPNMDPDDGTKTDPELPPIGVEPSVGCGADYTLGFTCFDVPFGPNTRKWCMNVPESYDKTRAYGIIIGLHGCGGQATNVHSHRANMEAYGAQDFLFAYPQAVNSCWVSGDIPFVEHVVETITEDYCVNEGRVFVHGMSSGGSMSSWVAASGLVLAFASVSAGGSAYMQLPAWYYAGRSDSYYSIIESTATSQRNYNGCSMTSTPIPDSPCVEYQGCEQPVTYCEDDQGHVWPADEWAQEGMIDFFRAVP